jgi:ribosomal protein L37AE/L43A
MEEYFNSIKDYYSEKNDNTKCSNCQTNKNFLETTDELIFSCGGEGKCGTKLKIKLATYENVYEKINLLKHFLKENIYYDNLHKLYKMI